jgi:hypothetical protein
VPIYFDPERAPGDRWRQYAFDGDQFFVAYLVLSGASSKRHPDLTSPWFFTGGHTLELYLKAAQLKHDPALTNKQLGSHNSNAMVNRWNACRQIKGCPLPFDMQPFNKDRTMFNFAKWAKSLPMSERQHYLLYGNVYRSIHHLVDLKYLSAGGPSLPDKPAYAWVMPDKYLIEILQNMRAWLGHNYRGGVDVIAQMIAELPV